jgi:hypothetical protein
MNPYFKLVLLLGSALVSFGLILPYLFSGDTFMVITGFVYLILYPWVVWKLCAGKLVLDSSDIVIGKEDK